MKKYFITFECSIFAENDHEANKQANELVANLTDVNRLGFVKQVSGGCFADVEWLDEEQIANIDLEVEEAEREESDDNWTRLDAEQKRENPIY